MKIIHDYKTTKISRGLNSWSYIMLHHTWPWADLNLVKYLAWSSAPVSCHFVVWKKGDIWQLSELGARTWHAWVSKRQWQTELNQHAIGIEICSNWTDFNDIQRQAVRELTNYLLSMLNLTPDKIITHADVAGFRGKRDVWPNFWNNKYASWEEYQNSYKKEPLTEKERNNLELLKRLNSWFWNKFEFTELRNDLHKTNKTIDLILE